MANSVTARFNDDCKVFVSMSNDTTVEKAVIIDAEGNETDIGGGGGGSDFSTAEVTLTATIPIDEGFISSLPVLESDGLSTLTEINLDGHNQIIKTIVLYKGKTTVPGFGFFTVNSISGNIAADGESYIITGNCTVTLAPTE